MAQVFHRTSGRAWRLRQSSLALWGQWIDALRCRGHGVELKRGLLLLASSPDEQARQEALCQQRQAMGLPFELWSHDQITALQPQLPQAALGGLWSGADGQVDPVPLMQALLSEAQQQGSRILNTKVQTLQPEPDGRWRLELANGDTVVTTSVVIGAGSGSAALLEPLGLRVPMAPVLGQALELQIDPDAAGLHGQGHWPAAAVVWQGINLVPRPGGRLWLGATLEPGRHADPQALASLTSLNGHAPAWLQAATVVRHWQGLRMQPLGRGAPWLEQLASGLLLAGCHYRNGLLLAPATATWIADALQADARQRGLIGPSVASP